MKICIEKQMKEKNFLLLFMVEIPIEQQQQQNRNIHTQNTHFLNAMYGMCGQERLKMRGGEGGMGWVMFC